MSQWHKWAMPVALAVSAAGWLPPTAAADTPLKVGFIYVGPIGDAGWTFSTTADARRWKKRLRER